MGKRVTHRMNRLDATRMVERMDVCSVIEDSGSHGEGGLKSTKRDKLGTAHLVFATTAEVWEASRIYDNHRGLGCR